MRLLKIRLLTGCYLLWVRNRKCFFFVFLFFLQEINRRYFFTSIWQINLTPLFKYFCLTLIFEAGARYSSVVEHLLIVRWVAGSILYSGPIKKNLFHNWCNKSCGICYFVLGTDILLLIRNNSLKWWQQITFLTIWMVLYHKTINKFKENNMTIYGN